MKLRTASILVGCFVMLGGVTAGLLARAGDRKALEAARAETKPVEPKPPEPKPEPKPEPEKKPEPIVPQSVTPKPEPPRVAAGEHYQLKWTKPVAAMTVTRSLFSQDGKSVYVIPSDSDRIESFDFATGQRTLTYQGPLPRRVFYAAFALEDQRLAAVGYPNPFPIAWSAKSGGLLPLFQRVPVVPSTPTQSVPAEIEISPSGRFVFIGMKGANQGGGLFGPAPFRILDATTGANLLEGEWSSGSARFTPDSKRILIAESNGKLRWVNLPSGRESDEWTFQPTAGPILSTMSTDGAVVFYNGKPPGKRLGCYLLNGKNGEVIRELPPASDPQRSAVSADGQWIASAHPEAPDFKQHVITISEAATGRVRVRTPIALTANDIGRVSYTSDLKRLLMHDRTKREVAGYELVDGDAVVQAPPVPPKVPPLPPPPVNRPNFPPAPILKPKWTIATETGIMANQLPQAPLFSRDGNTLILSGGDTGTILTFDPKTGKPGKAFAGHTNTRAGVYWALPFGKDRVVSGGFDAKDATWDTTTGQPVDSVKFAELPPLPDGVPGHGGITHGVSPGGRFTVIARREAAKPPVAGPLRVLDTQTGRMILQGDWTPDGHAEVRFTTDESRMFVLDGLGRATWYKLPSGEKDLEWRYNDPGGRAKVLGMTADGKQMLFHGPAPGQPYGIYLIEGDTGKVARRLGGAPYQAPWSTISPDGRFAAMGIIDFEGGPRWYLDLFELSPLRLVGRFDSPDEGGKDPPHFAFTPDSRGLSIFYPKARELRMYSLPDSK